jgi:Ca-activated chloride channel family protein
VSFTVVAEGPLAEITVEQTFVNNTPAVVDGVYVFPLHEEAEVDGLVVEVNGTVVRGEVLELQKAQDSYDEALRDGHVAALTTQARPNVFTQHVGNVSPGESVRVELRVVQPVPRVDGAYQLVLPLVVAPRFVRPDEPLEPGPLVGLGDSPLRANIDVRIRAAVPIVEIGSPSHGATFHLGEGVHGTTVEVPLDRDFVLRWRGDPSVTAAGAIAADGHLLLAMEAPYAPPRTDIVPRELIWVIDQSCSMTGEPIELVRRAMHRALDHMDERDSLRILRFSNRVQGDSSALPATPEVIARARRQIDELRTDGGTYLLEGVLAALEPRRDRERERYVIFLTDALISADKSVLDAIRDRLNGARLFTFGVGPAPNRWLLDEMARLGGGYATWLRTGEAVDRFVGTFAAPVLTDVTVDWGDWQVVETWPRRLPALYAGQPMLLTTRVIQPGTTPIVVRARTADGTFERVLVPSDAASSRAISSTWARQAIAHLERDQEWGDDPIVADQILGISLKYQVLSRYTAFLAVDRSRVVDTSEPGPVLTREFLRRVPAGRSYQQAIGGASGVAGGESLGTDPAAGTFSCEFVVAEAPAPNILDEVVLPDRPWASRAAEEDGPTHGTNTLGADLDLSHGMGAGVTGGLTAERVDAKVTGNIVRDKAWFSGAYDFDATAHAERVFAGHGGAARLDAMPASAHRLGVTLKGDVATLHDDGVAFDQDDARAAAYWKWFPSDSVNVATSASARTRQVAGRRQRGGLRPRGAGLADVEPAHRPEHAADRTLRVGVRGTPGNARARPPGRWRAERGTVACRTPPRAGRAPASRQAPIRGRRELPPRGARWARPQSPRHRPPAYARPRRLGRIPGERRRRLPLLAAAPREIGRLRRSRADLGARAGPLDRARPAGRRPRARRPRRRALGTTSRAGDLRTSAGPLRPASAHAAHRTAADRPHPAPSRGGHACAAGRRRADRMVAALLRAA